jgi:uncharacterized protein YdeI (BOF family)
MNRTTKLFAGFLLAIAPLAFGQEPQSASQFPEDALAHRQLIAWSRLQEPQPAPQPAPPRDNRVPRPDQQDQPGKQPADPQTPQDQTPVTQSFTGEIIKDGNRYLLKVASNITYDLQAQGGVKRYENQKVRVTGDLDKSTNSIRVVKIELLS